MVKQEIKELKLNWTVRMDMALILDLFKKRASGADLKFSKSFEANFKEPASSVERAIKQEIDSYQLSLVSELESELFKQKSRQNKAIEALKLKHTKKNESERDVAGRQIERISKRL